MNRAETLALFAQGKDAWNAWANDMLAKRKALEAAGEWKVDWENKPTNSATEAWAAAATADFSTTDNIHIFEQPTDFRECLFPWVSWFEDSAFAEEAYFRDVTFEGEIHFEGAVFSGHVEFTDSVFLADAEFERIVVKSRADFSSTTFINASFRMASFEDEARFEGAVFSGEALFSEATFAGCTWFMEAQFEAGQFSKTQFLDDAYFLSIVANELGFEEAVFSQVACFSSSEVAGSSSFGGARFHGSAEYARVVFGKMVNFEESTFFGIADFDDAAFNAFISYSKCIFKNHASFVRARFLGRADFSAICSERAFSLAGADFHRVPDFSQAHFSEAPRLDNSHFRAGFVEPGSFWGPLISRVKRLFGGDPDVPARWRALKRLAIQGHDHEREQTFFPMEIRSARFVTDWPLPLQPYVNRRRAKFGEWLAIDPGTPSPSLFWKLPLGLLAVGVPLVFWRGAAWLGFFRFWFGIVYQILSNFGRSVFRPALFFLALAAVSAVLYLQESDGSNGAASKPFADLARAVVTSPVTSAADLRAAYPCFSGDGQSLGGLSPLEAARTDKISEALHLAFANGSIVGSLGTSESARRTYGCLYGFVRDQYGASHLVVPPGVTLWATLQKTLSVILIFLFGLAVRNMLKVR